MTRRKTGASEGRAHRFGGDWTSEKLDILRGYLVGYTTALKNQPFKTGYIDAFAGTGYRTVKQTDPEEGLLFPELAEDAPQGMLDGSAKLALQVVPRFDSYIFIEKDKDRCRELEKLKLEFPSLSSDIDIQPMDANRAIQGLCKKKWDRHRAVLFLDPYGMDVEWATIQGVAATAAIDLWLLFPLGIGVNRLLPRSGKIPASWRNRLNSLLGTDDWYNEFYEQETSEDLFGIEETTSVKKGIEVISRYFVSRLETVFPGVSPNPRILMNSTGSPLYLLCFAVGNPSKSAQKIALRIANSLLLKKV